MATMVGRGKIQLAAYHGPFQKTPAQMQKNLADSSYTSRDINNFVPNFVAMAKRSVEKNAIGSIRWHIPENPL